jgi:hypothetical protein
MRATTTKNDNDRLEQLPNEVVRLAERDNSRLVSPV